MFSNTISFDAHVLQVFPPLTVGGCLVIAKPDGHFDPSYIVSLMLAHQVTTFGFTVPTLVSWEGRVNFPCPLCLTTSRSLIARALTCLWCAAGTRVCC